jgi:ankyrin repeat protein
MVDQEAFFDAVLKGDAETVNALIAAEDIDVNQAKITTGATPLYIAAQNGHTDVVKALIAAKDIDVNQAKTTTDATPLYIAAQNGHTDVVKALIAAGADVNKALTTTGATPLYIAAENGHTDVVKALIAAEDIDVNQATTTTGSTPLYIAAQNGHIDVVKALIAAKDIDVNQAKTTTGATPLYIAAQQGHIDVVKELIAAGAKINERDIKRFDISNKIKNILKEAAISQLVSQLLIDTPASIPEEWLKKLAASQKNVLYNMLLKKCGENIGLLQTAVDNQTLRGIFSPNGGYFLFEKNYMKLLREKISLLSNVDFRARVDHRAHAQKWQLCGNPIRRSRQGYSRLGSKYKAD